MVSDELKHEVLKVWLDYEEAVKTAFRFPATAHMSAEGLEDLFRAGNDDAARPFISYLRGQTEAFRSMKFVGEK
jgi:hypothetical protein